MEKASCAHQSLSFGNEVTIPKILLQSYLGGRWCNQFSIMNVSETCLSYLHYQQGYITLAPCPTLNLGSAQLVPELTQCQKYHPILKDMRSPYVLRQLLKIEKHWFNKNFRKHNLLLYPYCSTLAEPITSWNWDEEPYEKLSFFHFFGQN